MGLGYHRLNRTVHWIAIYFHPLVQGKVHHGWGQKALRFLDRMVLNRMELLHLDHVGFLLLHKVLLNCTTLQDGTVLVAQDQLTFDNQEIVVQDYKDSDHRQQYHALLHFQDLDDHQKDHRVLAY